MFQVVAGDPLARKFFVVHGFLRFQSEVRIGCDVELSISMDGKVEITCIFYLTTHYVRPLLNLLEKRETEYSSFEGSTDDGVKISIQRMALNNSNVEGIFPHTGPILDKYKIEHDILKEYLQRIGKLSNRSELDKNIGAFSEANFLVNLTYISASKVEIIYAQIEKDQVISSRWGLVNLEFGKGPLNDAPTSVEKDNLVASVSGYNIVIKKKLEYHEIIQRLVQKGNPEVTTEGIIQGRYADIMKLDELIEKLCFLISFATTNWIVPLYRHIYIDDKLVHTSLYNTKLSRFVNSKYVINSRDNNTLRAFLETTSPEYDNLLNIFALNKVIDYYLSSHRNDTLEDKYILAYITLEVLCSRAVDYAKQCGDCLIPKAIEETRNKLKDVMEKLNKSFSDEEIEEVTDLVAYNKVGLKDAQKYLLDKFGVSYDSRTLTELYKIRNTLFHGSDIDFLILKEKTNELCDLLDRTILKMLGWRGEYISKQKEYQLVRLL